MRVTEGYLSVLAKCAMDNTYLRYFVAIAEHRSFTRAAEILNTVQPSLSAQMKRLEEIVGTPLFVRGKHHLALTEAGRVFLDDARYILEYTERAMERARRAAKAEAGCLTVGLLPNMQHSRVGEIIHIYLERCPDMEVRLRHLSSPEQIAAIREQVIDIGFVVGEFDHQGLEVELFQKQTIMVLLPLGHPLSSLDRVPVAQLKDTPMIGFSPEKLPGPLEIAKKLAMDAGVHFRSSVEVDGLMEASRAVERGFGFAFLPDYFAALAPGVTMKTLALNPPQRMDMFVVYRRDNHLPSLAFFLNLLLEHRSGQRP